MARLETNLYFDNEELVGNTANYIFDVTCDKGCYYDDRCSFTPLSEDAGFYKLVLTVRKDQNQAIGQARTQNRAVELPEKKNVTILAIGDRHLQRDVYLQPVLDSRISDPALDLELIGSRGAGNQPPTNQLRHEGYNAWTAQAFAKRKGPKPRTGFYVPAEIASPSLDAKDRKLQVDFRKYGVDMKDGQPAYFVVIQVGGNEVWRAGDATISETFEYYDILIGMVHDGSSTTRVAITLLDPPVEEPARLSLLQRLAKANALAIPPQPASHGRSTTRAICRPRKRERLRFAGKPLN